jgi:hypothetical protein
MPLLDVGLNRSLCLLVIDRFDGNGDVLSALSHFSLLSTHPPSISLKACMWLLVLVLVSHLGVI